MTRQWVTLLLDERFDLSVSFSGQLLLIDVAMSHQMWSFLAVCTFRICLRTFRREEATRREGDQGPPGPASMGFLQPRGDRGQTTSNKKVLLRKRKRHTARRVVSTPSVVLPRYPPGTGYLGYPGQVPPQGGTQGGYLTWVPPGGVPRGGTRVRYPPRGVPGSVTPPGGVRVPPAASWHSGKCCKHYGIWVPPPVDRQIDGWTDACQNITFPRTTYAGGNNVGPSGPPALLPLPEFDKNFRSLGSGQKRTLGNCCSNA